MLLTEVCHDVTLKPVLHPLSGEELQHATARAEDEARVDIAARNFWGNRQVAYFDVKVFNPTPSRTESFLWPHASPIMKNPKRDRMSKG